MGNVLTILSMPEMRGLVYLSADTGNLEYLLYAYCIKKTYSQQVCCGNEIKTGLSLENQLTVLGETLMHLFFSRSTYRKGGSKISITCFTQRYLITAINSLIQVELRSADTGLCSSNGTVGFIRALTSASWILIGLLGMTRLPCRLVQ